MCKFVTTHKIKNTSQAFIKFPFVWFVLCPTFFKIKKYNVSFPNFSKFSKFLRNFYVLKKKKILYKWLWKLMCRFLTTHKIHYHVIMIDRWYVLFALTLDSHKFFLNNLTIIKILIVVVYFF